jgi:pimeloyl-ACP methyl ester carboxylesterase
VTPRWEAAGVARILDFMRTHGAGFDSIDEAADVIAAYMPHRPRKSAHMLASLLERCADGSLRWHWDARFVHDLSSRIESGQDELLAAARSIRVPTLLVTGGASDVVSRETIEDFLGLVPHAQHRQIADARHMVAGDDNDAFANALLAFLGGLPMQPNDCPVPDPAPNRIAMVRSA